MAASILYPSSKIQWGRYHGNIQPGKSNGDVYFLPFPTKYNGGGTTETFNQEDQMAASILYPSQQNTVGASPRKHFHLPHSHPPISHPPFFRSPLFATHPKTLLNRWFCRTFRSFRGVNFFSTWKIFGGASFLGAPHCATTTYHVASILSGGAGFHHFSETFPWCRTDWVWNK